MEFSQERQLPLEGSGSNPDGDDVPAEPRKERHKLYTILLL
jgi:hypothetical protein